VYSLCTHKTLDECDCFSAKAAEFGQNQGVTDLPFLVPPASRALLLRDARAIAGVEKLRFFPLAVQAGHGSFLTEVGGRELLDFSSSWTAGGLGYGHPHVVEAIHRAALHQPGAGGISAVHPAMVELAEKLQDIVPGSGDRRVYLGNSGTDANDVVLRCCQHATGNSRIITFSGSYHGGVGLAMGVSGVHVEAGAPAARAATFIPFPDPFRPHTGDAHTVLSDTMLRLDNELSAGDVACVIVEAIQSDGGIVVPPNGFLRALWAACDKYGVILICDEVKVGLGRTGLLHAFDLEGIVPDVVTFGKVLGGGVPLSAAVGRADILDGPVASALLTTAGNPIAAAAGLAVLEVLESESLVSQAKSSGEFLSESLLSHFDSRGVSHVVGEVRGRGLTIGVDLVSDRNTKTRDPMLARKVIYRAWELGVVVYYVGGNILEVTPALTTGRDDLAHGAQIIADAISDVLNGAITDEQIAPFLGW